MNDESKAPQIGKKAPVFRLPNQDNKTTEIRDFRDSWSVLYFYPKDNTPGCTTQALEFSADIKKFDKLNCKIIGISPDSFQSHRNFIEKRTLKVTLLSDSDHKIIEKYGCWQLKKLYGREFMGVVRTTFLLNPEGRIVHIWHKVKPKGHSEEVLTKLKELIALDS